MIFTGCTVLPLRDLLVRATLILLLFAFIYRASWDAISLRIHIFRIAWSLISLALLDYYTMHFGWNFELLYCRWLFCFCFFLSHRFNSFYLLYLDIPYPVRSTPYTCAILNVISFACNRMSWRAGNRNVGYVWSTEYRRPISPHLRSRSIKIDMVFQTAIGLKTRVFW